VFQLIRRRRSSSVRSHALRAASRFEFRPSRMLYVASLMMVQSLLCSVIFLCCCIAAALVGLVRGSTEGAPAEKSCRVGNGLGNAIASIVRAFWGFIVIVITTLTTLRSKRL
jgi:hypothetical protein